MTKAVPAPTRMSCDDPATNDQVSQARQAELNAALQKYLDLMYDCDTSRFDQVFRPTAQLHGFRDREMQVWPMDVYRDMLDRRQSPKSQNAPREDQILFVDFASPTVAFIGSRPGCLSIT